MNAKSRSRSIRVLVCALLAVAILGATVPSAYAAHVYTPAKGTSTRRELMKSAHEAQDATLGKTKPYRAYELHVYKKWAVGSITPIGSHHSRWYSVVAWHRWSGKWHMIAGAGVSTMGDVGDEPAPTTAQMRASSRKFLRSKGVPNKLVMAMKFK